LEAEAPALPAGAAAEPFAFWAAAWFTIVANAATNAIANFN
jgi:hypothetical protein